MSNATHATKINKWLYALAIPLFLFVTLPAKAEECLSPTEVLSKLQEANPGLDIKVLERFEKADTEKLRELFGDTDPDDEIVVYAPAGADTLAVGFFANSCFTGGAHVPSMRFEIMKRLAFGRPS